MMQNSISNSNRLFLVCPYRTCLIPVEDKPDQTNFKLHVITCKNFNFLADKNTVEICALNHHFLPIHKQEHILCESIVKNYSDNQEFQVLRNNVEKWTVFPFKPKVMNFHNLMDIHFDVNSTLEQGYHTAKIFKDSLQIQFLSLTRGQCLSTSSQQQKKISKTKVNNVAIKDQATNTDTSQCEQHINPDYSDFIHIFEPQKSHSSILQSLLRQ